MSEEKKETAVKDDSEKKAQDKDVEAKESVKASVESVGKKTEKSAEAQADSSKSSGGEGEKGKDAKDKNAAEGKSSGKNAKKSAAGEKKETAKSGEKKNKQQNEEPQVAVAYLKTIKSSPLKVRKLTNNLIDLPVQEVLAKLMFCNLKVAAPVRALIYSAMANAENNHNMDIDNLFVYKIEVGKSFTMRRFRARARGRGNRILKRFSNIKVMLAEKV